MSALVSDLRAGQLCGAAYDPAAQWDDAVLTGGLLRVAGVMVEQITVFNCPNLMAPGNVTLWGLVSAVPGTYRRYGDERRRSCRPCSSRPSR